jgi:two-component system, NarL family, invasion response regulator UvrY
LRYGINRSVVMIKVLLADDHQIVRQGLKQILQDEFSDIEFIEASNGNEVIEKSREKDHHIIILDISMPGKNGLEILKQIKHEGIETPILILSMHGEDQYAIRMLKAGASGYLTKDSASEELVNAVRRLLEGRKYISENVAEKLVNDYDVSNGNKPPHELISDREFQVLCLIAAGKTVTEIAENLHLSANTISTYRARILEKMGMKNSAELTHYAIQQGLV